MTYDTGLTAGHTETHFDPMYHSVNTPSMVSLRGSGDDEEFRYLDSKLQFNWRNWDIFLEIK